MLRSEPKISFIYVAIDDSDGIPILSSMSLENIVDKLDIFNGLNPSKPDRSKRISDNTYTDIGEFNDELVRVIEYSSIFMDELEPVISKYNIYKIEIQK